MYKVEEFFGQEVLKLCLDFNTYHYLCSVLHNSGFHYNPEIIRCHLDRHFFAVKAKLASVKAHNACVACQLNLTPRKTPFINNWDGRYLTPGQCISADFCSNLPLCRIGNSSFKELFLAVDTATGLLSATPCKDVSTASAITGTLEAFASLSLPLELRTDFATCFANQTFISFVEGFGVTMTKTTPSRSEGQGWIETSVRSFRHLFTKLLVDAPPLCSHLLAHFSEIFPTYVEQLYPLF